MPSGSLPLPLGLSHYNRVTLHRVALHQVGLVVLQPGQSHYNWVGHTVIGSVALLLGLAGALSLPAFVPLLCTLFPPTPCEGLAFTYTLPYLASVTVTLGTCPLL